MGRVLTDPTTEVEPETNPDDEPDDEPTDEPADATDDEPTAVETGEPTEAQLRALDDENRRHERRLHEIMGPFVEDFVPCEPCAGSGLVPPDPPPCTHPHYKACPTCNGYGEIITGSLRDDNRTAACPSCARRGYVQRLDTPTAPAPSYGASSPEVPLLPPSAEPVPGFTPEPNGAASEQWGVPTWMGDPSVKPG